MKKHFLFSLVCILMTLLLTASASALSSGENPEVSGEPETYSSDWIIYEEDGAECYRDRYVVSISDDGTALLTYCTEYPDGSETTNSTPGTCTLDSGTLEFRSGSDQYESVYSFSVSGNTLSDLSCDYTDADAASASGLYICLSERTPDAAFVLNRNGSALLAFSDGTVYSGSASRLDDNKWYFSGSSDGETYPDWALTLTDISTFSYETYRHYLYAASAGSYSCFGDLGSLVLVVNEDGFISTDISLGGTVIHLTGSAFVDSGTNELTGASLQSEEGFGLELTLCGLPDGTLNYYGSLSVPLNAG